MTLRYRALVLTCSMFTATSYAADDDLYSFVQADRLEFVSGDDSVVWDVQGWVGGDYHKLWVKAEGEYEGGSSRENEVQLLYSHAHSPFFDWQIGLRHDLKPGPSRNQFVFGVQGLAPQWFEIDAAGFVSEDGDVSFRFEAEYEWLLTQRLVLQPRFEVEVAVHDVPQLAVGSGIVSTDLGLRLRYEVRRKFAPYLGISWTKLHGETSNLAILQGDDDNTVSVVAGLRFWF